MSFARLFGFGSPMLRLDGENIYLRPPERRDWAAWAAVRAESRHFLAPWEPSWPANALSRESYRCRWARHTEDWEADLAYTFFIFRKSDSALLGGIGLSNVRRGVAETASVGYWIGVSYARQGFMREALKLTLDFSFGRLHLHRVEAACLPHNRPSRNLLLQTGFTEEGLAREYLRIDGRWQDHILFGILRDDWKQG